MQPRFMVPRSARAHSSLALGSCLLAAAIAACLPPDATAGTATSDARDDVRITLDHGAVRRDRAPGEGIAIAGHSIAEIIAIAFDVPVANVAIDDDVRWPVRADGTPVTWSVRVAPSEGRAEAEAERRRLASAVETRFGVRLDRVSEDPAGPGVRVSWAPNRENRPGARFVMGSHARINPYFTMPAVLGPADAAGDVTPPAFRSGSGRVGSFYIGDGTRSLAIASEEHEGRRLAYLDTDRDGDLSDETPVTLSAEPDGTVTAATVRSLEGFPITYELFRQEIFEAMIPRLEQKSGISPVTEAMAIWNHRRDSRRTTIEIGGTSVLVGIYDFEFDGRFDSERDRLMIDLDGDGELTTDLVSPETTDGAHLRRIGDAVYRIEIDPAGDWIGVTRVEGVEVAATGFSIGDPFPVRSHPMLGGGKGAITPESRSWTLIDVWGDWCAPCVAKIPSLVKLEQELDAYGFAIEGLILPNDQGRAIEILKERGATWTNLVIGDAEARDTYFVSAFPTTFLLDAGGNVVAINPSEDEIRSFVLGA